MTPFSSVPVAQGGNGCVPLLLSPAGSLLSHLCVLLALVFIHSYPAHSRSEPGLVLVRLTLVPASFQWFPKLGILELEDWVLISVLTDPALVH